MKHMALVAALLVAAALAFADDASACRCAPLDPRKTLENADAAFIGTLVERRRVRGAYVATFVFRVEHSVKGDLGDTVTVETAWHGASCGIEAGLGQRLGLFLDRDGDRWVSGLCSQIPPEELLRAAGQGAAGPLPAPAGRNPLAFLAGGAFGPARTLALDEEGRTIAYGAGGGETRAIATCPGARTIVELVMRSRAASVAVRDLRSFRLVRETSLELEGRYPSAVSCLTGGGDAAVFARAGSSDAVLVRVIGSRQSTVWQGPACAAGLTARSAFVSAGVNGTELVRIDLWTGRTHRLAAVPEVMGRPALSPDGRWVAAVSFPSSSLLPWVVPPTGPPNIVVVRADGSGLVRTAALREHEFGRTLWLDGRRLAFVPRNGSLVRVYDTALRRLSARKAWSGHVGEVVRRGRLYGVGSRGRLISADPARSPVRVLGRLPTPPLVNSMTAVPGSIRVARVRAPQATTARGEGNDGFGALLLGGALGGLLAARRIGGSGRDQARAA